MHPSVAETAEKRLNPPRWVTLGHRRAAQIGFASMSRVLIERRLYDAAQRLKRAREELSVIEEQLAALAEAADEARIRSLVSETPIAHREYAEARRHADAMERTRRVVAADVAELQVTQDELLDRLVGDDHSGT